MDPKNLSKTDIDQWLRSAQPDQVVEIAHVALDRIANYPEQQRQNFSQRLTADTRSKLFQGEEVG